VSIVGVYPTDYDNFPLGQIFDKGLTVRAGQALAQRYVPDILREIGLGRLVADEIHHPPAPPERDG
jgi:threonine dehydrogenase-like Zn-dependent dehydrogenase